MHRWLSTSGATSLIFFEVGAKQWSFCAVGLLNLLRSIFLVSGVMGPIIFQSSGVTPASGVCVAYGNLECCNTG